MEFSKKATWELRAIVKALSLLPALNTAADNATLEAVKLELAKRKK